MARVTHGLKVLIAERNTSLKFFFGPGKRMNGELNEFHEFVWEVGPWS